MQTLRALRYIPQLNRKKKDPREFVFSGDIPVTETDIQVFKYNSTDCYEHKDVKPADIELFSDNDFNYWLNIYGLEPEIIAAICRQQNIHDLAIQDILDVRQRPKFQEFDGHSFLVIKSIVPDKNEMISEQISFVFGKNVLLSFQERKADFFEHIRYRLRKNKGIVRERGADYLLYTLLESILDNYFKTLTQLDAEVEKLSFTDPDRQPRPDTLALIENHKKSVHFIRKVILPIKEFTMAVERGETQFIQKRHLKYFMEIKDLCLTLLDSCDMIQSSLESSTNLFFSIQGHRMNQIMKTLTVVASIFIPLTFIAGIYGMNFTNMPELEWKYGYAAVWGLILLIIAGMILFLKRRKWF
ncbi:MAG: magnesium/cobalt transporter CorA [Bacteroidales bacterium]|nr:magnesium/cobalt transporter CorA [Bacteroidales bacterium]